jgi:hypothetical protein
MKYEKQKKQNPYLLFVRNVAANLEWIPELLQKKAVSRMMYGTIMYVLFANAMMLALIPV